jgi:hypothetical protein
VRSRGLPGGAALSTPAALLLFTVYAAPRVSGYADAAPPGFSGGFGEPSCHACHFHAELNSAPGRVTMTGVPDRFTPGSRYPLTITLTRPAMKLAGLQLTARFKDGGAQAGMLAPDAGEHDRVRIDAQRDVQYVNQRRKGTSLDRSNTAIWRLIWTAPPSGGPVVLHVAANAADGDDTVEGDYIYTATVESAPTSVTKPPTAAASAGACALPAGRRCAAASTPLRAGRSGGRARIRSRARADRPRSRGPARACALRSAVELGLEGAAACARSVRAQSPSRRPRPPRLPPRGPA